MPLFEFRCSECRHLFEALCRDSRAEGVICPVCGAAGPARLLSTFAVSRQLSPCGTPRAEAASRCGFNASVGACERCAH